MSQAALGHSSLSGKHKKKKKKKKKKATKQGVSLSHIGVEQLWLNATNDNLLFKIYWC